MMAQETSLVRRIDPPELWFPQASFIGYLYIQHHVHSIFLNLLIIPHYYSLYIYHWAFPGPRPLSFGRLELWNA